MPTTPLPIPPSSSRPQTVAQEADAFLAALPVFQQEMDALGTQASADAAAAEASKNIAVPAAAAAADAAANATEAKEEAQGYALSALMAPGTNGTSATLLAIPAALPSTVSFVTQAGKEFRIGMTVNVASASSPRSSMQGTILAYNVATGAMDVEVERSRGVGSYSDWVVSIGAPGVSPPENTVLDKTAGFTVSAGDIGQFFSCSGSFTVAYDATSALGQGFYHFVRNDGSGTITLDPNGAETIDLVTSTSLLRGESALVISDGSRLRVFRFNGRYQVITSTANYVRSESATSADVFLIGGGGGGGSGGKWSNAACYGGAGGGGGGFSHRRFPTHLLAASTLVTIGAGGAGGAAVTGAAPVNGNSGTAGGDTTFGGWLRAKGGAGGGAGGATVPTAGAGGAGCTENGGNGATHTTAAPSTMFAAAGGGSGSGVTATTGSYMVGAPGGSVGMNAGYATTINGGAVPTGTAPNVGGSAPVGSAIGGAGGGGGFTNPGVTSVGYVGGAGGAYGGGGAGGGAGSGAAGNASGAGGAGANGVAIILED